MLEQRAYGTIVNIGDAIALFKKQNEIPKKPESVRRIPLYTLYYNSGYMLTKLVKQISFLFYENMKFPTI